jgi:hypothetical protein
VTKLDWLKFVGWYAMGAAVAVTAGYLFGGPRFGEPIYAIVVFIAAGTPVHAGVRAWPLPFRPTLMVMAALMALGALAVALGEATVGWHFGWKDALALAGMAAVFYPLLFNWAGRRKARTAAFATDPNA